MPSLRYIELCIHLANQIKLTNPIQHGNSNWFIGLVMLLKFYLKLELGRIRVSKILIWTNAIK